MNYIPLQVQSEYTFLSSGLKIEDLIRICKKQGNEYISIADIENMYAFPHFNELCIKNNLKPIFGCGININVQDLNLLIYLYIKDEVGYSSLCKIISSKEKTINLLKENNQGLILIIPTLSNPLLMDIIHDESKFSKVIFSLSSLFQTTYIGIEYYQKNDKEIVNKIRNFCAKHNYQKICFPKHLYEKKSDALIIKILNAIKNDERLSSKDEIEGPYYFLGEFAANFLYTKDEIASCHKLVKSIDFTFNKKRGTLLNYPYSSSLEKKKFLQFLCLQNAKKNSIELNESYHSRLDYEIELIDNMGYCDYFLIVQDYVNYAKEHHIPVGPGRGSAAGSLVSYLLGITEVDPLKYGLMFERFLNPGRITMPDIDIDIADYARQNVIDYIYKKYGEKKMSYIVTFQTIAAKQSLRDIGRVFSINNADINTLCSHIKLNNQTLDDALENNPSFRSLCSDSYFHKIVSLAKRIEGFPRQSSLHAAGIILNNDDLNSVIPVTIGDDGKLVCQFESIYLEDQGFLKMDILGLRNLSIIAHCVNKIKTSVPLFDINKIPYNDERTFNVLNAGLTQGIFQLESEGITSSLRKVKVTSFDDLVALLALYRPGPMDNIPIYASRKNNNEKIEYIHPILEDILKTTYGVIIYQEQIMEIVQRISLFTLSEADIFRRAISKKDSSKLESLKTDFINGALKNNIEYKVALEIFELIYKFANYGFNKSHSVSYAIISYQMAYLKAHYYPYFYATLLSFSSINEDKYSKFSKEFRLFNLSLALPNINEAGLEFVIRPNNQIMLPLEQIKGLPINICKDIINERKMNGPYKSIEDVFSRLLTFNLSSAHFMSLINSGALDSFGYTRTSLRKVLPTLIQYAKNTSDEFSLLSEEVKNRFKPIIEHIKEDDELKLTEELNTLGIMISGSLFDKYSSFIEQNNIMPIFNVSSMKSSVKIGIIITKIKEIITKKKDTMAIVYGFDNSQSIEIIFFKDTYEKYQKILKEKNAIQVKGYFRNDENYGLSFICEEACLMEVNKK